MQRKDSRIEIRIGAEAKAKLQAYAEAENRSLSSYLANLIDRDICSKEGRED